MFRTASLTTFIPKLVHLTHNMKYATLDSRCKGERLTFPKTDSPRGQATALSPALALTTPEQVLARGLATTSKVVAAMGSSSHAGVVAAGSEPAAIAGAEMLRTGG